MKFIINITGKTPTAGNTRDVKIAVLLKYLSIFWITLEMDLIHCENNLILTWSTDGERKFAITDTKLYVPIVTLVIQDNANLLEQLKSAFRRTINWNKYQSKISAETQN